MMDGLEIALLGVGVTNVLDNPYWNDMAMSHGTNPETATAFKTKLNKVIKSV